MASIQGCMLGIAFVAALALSGCSEPTVRGPYDPNPSGQRDVRQAETLYQEAMAVVAEDPEEGERLLREALAFDLYHGRAHNNLGVLLLSRGLLYDAAYEFVWARKLLPGHPDPRLNLAICLDRGGDVDGALEAVQAALEVRPEYMPALQVLTLIELREGLTNERLLDQLAQIEANSPSKSWRSWARGKRLKYESDSTHSR